MKPSKVFLSVIAYITIVSAAFGQKEASHWFFSPRGYMDFNQNPPATRLLPQLDPQIYGQYFASIADASGNLVFYTDGRSFFNSQREIMLNGQGAYGDSRSTQTSFIIPKPGCKDIYYNFITELGSTNQEFSDNGWTIHYSVVDVAAENGKGKVIVKNKVLIEDQGDALAIFEGPDGESFWLVTTNSTSNEISSYKITSSGIHHCPVVSKLENKTFAAHYNIKASPDGKHLVMVRLTHVGNILQVHTFNNLSGSFSKKFELEHHHNNADNYPYKFKRYPYYHEFSPDGNNLFILEDDVAARSQTDSRVTSTLYKLDLNAPDSKTLNDTKVRVFEFPAGNPIGNAGLMQLSPDGRILIESFQKYLFAIGSPNSTDDFKFVEKAVTFGDWPGVLPAFPAFYFKEGGYKAPTIQNSCERTVCGGSSLTLSTEHFNPEYTYEWTNAETLEVLEGMNPVVHVPEDLAEAEESYYLLKITDKDNCHTYDVVKVVALPSPKSGILGSQSVCPGVEEVAYWAKDPKGGVSYRWTAEGGEIVQGQATDSILVNWGSTNPNALVTLTAVDNANGCQWVTEFPVKVFKQLETEKPKGADTLNCDDAFYSYSILPTNGSYYNWQIINGEILEGQGNAKVKVSWNEESEKGYLWIEESVNTDLEVCFGRSDTLQVINPKAKGNQQLNIHFVSSVRGRPHEMELNFSKHIPAFIEDDINVYHRASSESNGSWEEVSILGISENIISFMEPLSNKVEYEYKLLGQSVCGDEVSSTIHHNILLKELTIDERNNLINLEWNHYVGWNAGIKAYEVYRKLDGRGYDFYGQLTDELPKVSLSNLSEGLEHCFYVKAIANENSGNYSLSNEVCLTYYHPLLIPNVITPNGDDINEFFEIKLIELYPENELTIFNRHGKVVFHEKNYQNSWNARELPEGGYFYQLTTYPNKRNYKGWVQVIR